jgi:hypothetical protein
MTEKEQADQALKEYTEFYNQHVAAEFDMNWFAMLDQEFRGMPSYESWARARPDNI